jgi:hypothetical protein
MKREALVMTDGESFSVWDVTFGEMKQQRETHPCMIREPDGSSRKGTISFTVESATVSFCASIGMLAIGRKGQMSSGDQFFEVTISSVEPAADHLRVSAHAERKCDYH